MTTMYTLSYFNDQIVKEYHKNDPFSGWMAYMGVVNHKPYFRRRNHKLLQTSHLGWVPSCECNWTGTRLWVHLFEVVWGNTWIVFD